LFGGFGLVLTLKALSNKGFKTENSLGKIHPLSATCIHRQDYQRASWHLRCRRRRIEEKKRRRQSLDLVAFADSLSQMLHV
jgi:hypothetical protein